MSKQKFPQIEIDCGYDFFNKLDTNKLDTNKLDNNNFSKEELSVMFDFIITNIDDKPIHPFIIDALESCEWFDDIKKEEFVSKYNYITKLQHIDKNNKIIILRDKLNKLLKLKLVDKPKDFIDKIEKVSKFLFEPNDFNTYDNPLGSYKFDYATGDISCDSSSKYNSKNKIINCWQLEQNSKTSYNEISLGDVFEYNSWLTSSIKPNELDELIEICQIFCDVGLEVYYYSISTWRKGYDFRVTKFEPANPDKIHLVKNSEYFRIYIDKRY